MKEVSKKETGALLGIDVGGTFIDLVLRLDDGQEVSEKLLADPDHLIETIEHSVARLLDRTSVDGTAITKVVHATTRGSNAILERKGPEVALIATRGFRDVLQIGRALRWSMYDVQMEKPVPLVPRSRAFEVTERCLADGSILTPLVEEEVRLLAEELRQREITSVAVAFLHSYVAPAHERRVREILIELYPEIQVTISSDVSLQGREYERTNTAVVNAYLIPVLGGYLRELEQILPRLGISAPLWVMQSSGGLASAEQAAAMPVRTLESGPAAGVLASAHFGAECGHSDVLSLDMGGTTAKVAIVEGGVPSKSTSFELHRTQNRRGSGLPVDIAAIDLVEIGTGGGSIAERRFGVLQVGPQSAGAQPGPACYGRGGDKVTVTDANLLLGYLNPEQFAGGTMTLDVDAANIVMDALAKEIDLDRIRTAWGVHEVANLEMESALRLVSIDRGFDPRDFVLVCIGGAAGTHGSRLGRALGIRKMIVPPGAGVGSAVGLLEGRESVEFAQSTQIRLDDDDAGERATALLRALEISARESIGESWSNEVLSVRRAVGLRYVGQGYELTVPLNEIGDIQAEQVIKNFHDRYEKNYGYRETSLAAEAVTWYLTLSRVRMGGLPATQKIITEAELRARTRSVYLGDEGYVDVPVVKRQNLAVGTAIEGPCIIEEDYTTTLVLANDSVSVDTSGALVIEMGEE